MARALDGVDTNIGTAIDSDTAAAVIMPMQIEQL